MARPKGRDPENRQKIIAAATRLLTTEGVTRVSVLRVADEAGVNPKLLYRHFPGKLPELIRLVLFPILGKLPATVPTPSDDLERDLLELARRYWAFWRQHPRVLLFAFPDFLVDEEYREILESQQKSAIGRLTKLFGHHRELGHWCKAYDGLDDETLEDRLAVGFIGSLFARVTWKEFGIADEAFDAEDHVQRFLDGYGRSAS